MLGVTLAMSFLLASPNLVKGQLPGQRIPTRDRIHAEFISNIMDGINQAREGWMEEVEKDQLDPLMEAYTPDAMVIPPDGEPLYGELAIKSYWEENLPELKRIQTGLGDMDASGKMAMIAGTYAMERVGENGAVIRESGGLLTVFIQSGRDWLIRAQVFASPNPG